MSNYKWHFPATDGGIQQGFENEGMSYFKSDSHYYIARETIQNALDAKDDKKKGEPVVVEFRLFKSSLANAIPELSLYKKTLKENLKANKNNPVAKKFFERAIQITEQQTINILSISDSGTVGVNDINKDEGRWHGLIKMVGKGSQEQRNIGGTFGIGKAAPFVCSELRTVLYNTVNSQGESAYIWKPIFTTHGTPKKQGIGFFCEYGKENNESYANGISVEKYKPDFLTRKHNGTDLCILGFKKPQNLHRGQEWHHLFKKAILDNYFAALYDNELKVILKDDNNEYELNSTNVFEMLKDDYISPIDERNNKSSFPYLDAYMNDKNNVYNFSINKLGKCKFYLLQNDDYPRKISYMRGPKQLVFTKSNTRLKTGYSAVFITDSKAGNKYLSKCEGPRHDEWFKGWHSKEGEAATVLKTISMEVNKILNNLTKETFSEETLLSGLEQFTYIEEDENPIETDGHSLDGNDGDDGFTLDDNVIETHDIDYAKPNLKRQRRRKKVEKDKDGFGPEGEGGESGTGGRSDIGGEGGTTSGEKGDGPEQGGKGDKKYKKLPKTRFSYKCFQKSGDSDYNLVISSKFEEDCQMRLYAQGIDSDKNENIIIKNVKDAETGDKIEFNGNIVENIKTDSNPKTILLKVENNRKLGVEVELYAK
ncbi:hypothetical protein N9N24_04650 [Candidatus Marinimicrobia bacterium]|jgi:hypothetical protein|nr:hypothetical protein [Candidatus Neomarinimicrobiota bacterium]